jgi:hypothetical protein
VLLFDKMHALQLRDASPTLHWVCSGLFQINSHLFSEKGANLYTVNCSRWSGVGNTGLCHRLLLLVLVLREWSCGPDQNREREVART